MRSNTKLTGAVILSLLAASCAPESEPEQAATGGTVTLADYQRAEQFLSQNTNELVHDSLISQYWQQDDRLVYRKRTATGSEALIVDLTTGSRTSLYDPIALAAALEPFSDEDVEANDLAVSAIEIADDLESIEFDFDERRYTLSAQDGSLQQHAESPDNEYLSPDGSKAVFIEDHNLWLRDTASNGLTQLTFDGIENYGYGTNNAGWLRDEGPVLLWSPDSSKIATFRHDAREVGDMFLYTTAVGHSELDAWKYPLPGDDHIFMIERVVIHLDPSPRLVALDMPPDAHRSSTSDHVAGRGGRFLDVEWSEDSQTLAFLSSSRDHKSATLRIADPETGAVRDVYNETVATYFESGSSDANWRVLHDRNEFLWFSERDNWGHLYLYDLTSGELKHQITSGNWVVLEVEQVDTENDQVYFTGSNKEATDPYFRYLYRVNLDGSGLQLLTPEPANHSITWSESRDYFTDVYSTPTEPPIAVIRNKEGERIFELEQADISELLASGWVAPEPFSVKARDQQT
ncbi:MAG: DPP IV N-terminal domain-containing protein, partial [Pseudomonadales bacterium]|nr:DPP IV N-terminal domain-containing protein [Pseudomonadales bacterium]